MLTLLTVVAARSVRPTCSRRAVLVSTCSSAALGFLRPATPACAEGDILGGIVERAQSGELSIAKVIDRAKTNALVELSTDSLSCDILDQLVRVDQSACDSAGASIKTLQQAMRPWGSNDPIEQAQAKASLTELQTIKRRIDAQVGRLVALEEEKGCLDAVATYDPGAVAQRAKVGRLSTDRAIQRARSNQLVSVEDAKLGCTALDALREVDRKALQTLERETRRARDSGSSGGELDGLVVAEQNMRLQLSKADTRFASYCQGVDDLTAGAM